MSIRIKRGLLCTLLISLCSFHTFAEDKPDDTDQAAETDPAGEAGESTPKRSQLMTHSEYEALIVEDLKRNWPEQAVTELTAGEDAFIALPEAARKQPSRGAILLLHDLGGNVNDETVIRPIRQAFPDFGWETLSLQLPYVKMDDTKRGYLPMLDQTSARITQGLDQLKQSNPQYLILLGYGLGGAVALRYLDETSGANVHGVVLISLGPENSLQPDPKPVHPVIAETSTDAIEENAEGETSTESEAPSTEPASPASEQETAEVPPPAEDAEPELPPGKPLFELLRNRRVPLLDVYGQTDFRNVLLAAEQRQHRMRSLPDRPYTQRQIAGADHAYRGHEAALIRKIRGWLEITFPAR